MKKMILALSLCLCLLAGTGCSAGGDAAEDIGDGASRLLEDGGDMVSDLGDTASNLLEDGGNAGGLRGSAYIIPAAGLKRNTGGFSFRVSGASARTPAA